MEWVSNEGELRRKLLGCSASAKGLLGRFNYYREEYRGVRCSYDNSLVKIYIDTLTKEE